jgi:hypothetical protein
VKSGSGDAPMFSYGLCTVDWSAIAILFQTLVIGAAGWLAWRSTMRQISEVQSASNEQRLQFEESMLRADKRQRVSNALAMLDAFRRRVPYIYGELSPNEAMDFLQKLEAEDFVNSVGGHSYQYAQHQLEPEDPEARDRFRKGYAAADIVNEYFTTLDFAVEGGVVDRKLMSPWRFGRHGCSRKDR